MSCSRARTVPFVLFLLFSLGMLCAKAGVLLRGHILSADGKPIALSHVHLARWGNGVTHTFLSKKVGAGDDFLLELSGPGYFELWTTGIFHYAASAYLLTQNPADIIEVFFQLKPFRYRQPLDSVALIGSWNGFNFSRPLPMERMPDGRFHAEVQADADTVCYQRVGVEERGHSMNGTQGDFFVCDHAGHYCSKLRAPKGRLLEIVFDPSALPLFPAEHALPWLHAFLKGGFEDPVARAFEVVGIPKPVLIGSQGTIAAVEGGLRGERLLSTRETLLQMQNRSQTQKENKQ